MSQVQFLLREFVGLMHQQEYNLLYLISSVAQSEERWYNGIHGAQVRVLPEEFHSLSGILIFNSFFSVWNVAQLVEHSVISNCCGFESHHSN